MGKFDEEKHNAIRSWAEQNRCEDPENLILRNGGSVQFRGPRALKGYKRIEKMYDECMKAKLDQEAA